MKQQRKSPYGTFGFDKIEAPNKTKIKLTSTKTTGKGDLRCKKK